MAQIFDLRLVLQTARRVYASESLQLSGDEVASYEDYAVATGTTEGAWRNPAAAAW